MFIIGSILAETKFKTVFNRWTIYFSFIRLLLIPALILLVCYLLRVDSLVTAVAVVLGATPAGTTTAILAEKYGGDSVFGVQCVFLSTLLSLLSIPLWCVLIELVF